MKKAKSRDSKNQSITEKTEKLKQNMPKKDVSEKDEHK